MYQDEAHDYLVERLSFFDKKYNLTPTQWAAALTDAGIKIPRSGYGLKCEYRGIVYKSKAELEIAEWLAEHHLEFEYEVPYNDGTRRTFDFYVPALDLYIEYYGLISQTDYRNAVKEKRLAYDKKRVLEIYAHDNPTERLLATAEGLTYIPFRGAISNEAAEKYGVTEEEIALVEDLLSDMTNKFLPRMELDNAS